MARRALWDATGRGVRTTVAITAPTAHVRTELLGSDLPQERLVHVGQQRDGQASEVVRLWLDAALSHPHTHADVLKVLSTAVKLPEQAGTPGESPRDRLRAIARQWAKTAALQQSAGLIELPSAGLAHRAVYTELAQLLDDGIIETFQQTMAGAAGTEEHA